MATESKCKNCKHHDDFSWVCSNADSSYVGDFTNDEDWCSHFEVEKRDLDADFEKKSQNRGAK